MIKLIYHHEDNKMYPFYNELLVSLDIQDTILTGTVPMRTGERALSVFLKPSKMFSLPFVGLGVRGDSERSNGPPVRERCTWCCCFFPGLLPLDEDTDAADSRLNSFVGCGNRLAIGSDSALRLYGYIWPSK